MSEICALIHLDRLRVENANAVSGPLSWGFPAPTAFTGFAHALERRLGGLRLGGVGIVCHRFEPQVDFPAGAWRPGRFRLARHPYIAGWKKFKNETAAIVEEGRAHLQVSLLIAVLDELDDEERAELAAQVRRHLAVMPLAGGALRGRLRVRVHEWPEYADEQREAFRRLRYRLLPGFTLVQRNGALAGHLERLRRENPDAGPLDTFLDTLALHVTPVTDQETGAVYWRTEGKTGWIVPLPVGYAALASHDPGEVEGARDPEAPFRFVESLYTLGEWVSPHRLGCLEQILWYPKADTASGLYRCCNNYEHLIPKENLDEQEN